MKNIRFMLSVISLLIQNALSSDVKFSYHTSNIRDFNQTSELELKVLALQKELYIDPLISDYPGSPYVDSSRKLQPYFAHKTCRPVRILYGLAFGKMEHKGSSFVFFPMRGFSDTSNKCMSCGQPDVIDYDEFKKLVNDSLSRFGEIIRVANKDVLLINTFARTAPVDYFLAGSYLNYVDYQIARLIMGKRTPSNPLRLALIKMFRNGELPVEQPPFNLNEEDVDEPYTKYIEHYNKVTLHSLKLELPTFAPSDRAGQIWAQFK